MQRFRQRFGLKSAEERASEARKRELLAQLRASDDPRWLDARRRGLDPEGRDARWVFGMLMEPTTRPRYDNGAELESEVASLTLDMRSSDDEMWASVRKMIARHGADPQTTALAEHSWDGDYRGDDVYWVVFVTRDGSPGEFYYIPSVGEPWDPTVSTPLEDPLETQHPYLARPIAVARQLLEREAAERR